MARQPKLILRESAIDDVIASWQPGTFLETGAGTGYMTRKFLDLGYSGACFELSDSARVKLRKNLEGYEDRIQIANSLDELSNQEFDYLLSFEVLEHIEDYLAALRHWSDHLKPDGTLFITVPAHQRKFGKSDELAGHIRRYERLQLETLLKQAGFERILIQNYGFPVTEISRPVGNLIARRPDDGNDTDSPIHRSMQSSYGQQARVSKVINLIGERPLMPFCSLQRQFYNKDWGDGLFATARKS